MATPPLATVNALEEWLGLAADSLTGADAARAGAYLAAASTLVRSETRRAWLTAVDTLDESVPGIDDDDLAVAATIVVQAAARVWRNPAGVISESTGPFSATFSDAAALGVYLTPTDKEMLAAYRTTAKPTLWTLPTTRHDAVEGTDYLDVVGTAEKMPYIERGQGW